MSKVVLITGAGRGIGAATARLAATRGFAVCVNYRQRSQDAEAVVSSILSAGGEAFAVQADVADEAAVGRMFDECDRRLGPVTALVNNAGILEAQTTLTGIDDGRLRRVFATNVFGAFACARQAVLRMSTKR